MPLRGHQPPSDARMIGDISRRVSVLEREKNPATGVAGTFASAVAAPGGLTGWWRLGDTFTFATTVANAARDSAIFGGTARDLRYVEATSSFRPTLQVPNPNLGTDDDGAVRFDANNADTTFDGNGAAAITNVTQIGTTADQLRSFSVWFKTRVASIVDRSPIIGRWGMDTSGSFDHGWVLHTNTGGIEWIIKTSGGTTVTVAGPSLTTDTWYHVAGTFDGATYLLYLNGLLVGTVASATVPTDPVSPQFRIGGGIYDQGVSSIARYAYGLTIDEVSIYKTTLSAAQVTALASGIGAAVAVRTVTAAYAILPSDNNVLANGTFTVTLYTAVGNAGRRVTVKNTGTGTVTVSAAGTETIDGAGAPGTVSLATTKSDVVVVSDGSGWQIIRKYL